jgi:hypothetical protein
MKILFRKHDEVRRLNRRRHRREDNVKVAPTEVGCEEMSQFA